MPILSDKTKSKLDQVVDSFGGPNSKSGKVLVAMSGGVDSSVIPAILTKLGYECIGVHMQFWADDKITDPDEMAKFPENKCCSLESLEHAREIAHKYDMPFYVLNTRNVFKDKIVDYFVDSFEGGVTPNPCIECNRSIKFGFLLDKMRELGADFVATGHYAKVELLDSTPTTAPRFALKMANDKIKDQSYFLYTLTQEKLKHCLFPLADLSKKEVREIAEQENLAKVSKKKDSTGICFFPEKSHVPFLQRHMSKETYSSGDMVTKDGEVKGSHKGLPMYTIGQREGLEIGGPDGPWYVIGKDSEKNQLIVGSNEDLFSKEIKAKNLTFTNEAPTQSSIRILARLRHRFTPEPATLKLINDTVTDQLIATIIYDRPQRAITPGQSVVFYIEDEVIGGGIIQ